MHKDSGLRLDFNKKEANIIGSRKIPEYIMFDSLDQIEKYDKHSRKGMGYHARKVVQFAQKTWNIKEGKVLDIGSGPGTLAITFAKNNPELEVIGSDISDAAIEYAYKNAEKQEVSSKLTFQKGDAEKLPFDNQYFDLVVSSFTLHLVNDPLEMLNEVHRVLKPKGKYIISDFRRNILGFIADPIKSSYNTKELKQILGRSNLQNWNLKRSLFFWIIIHPK